MPRIYSLAALIAVWAVAAALVQSRLLPGPLAVGAAILADIRSGELPFQMGCTLARVIGSFAIAMVLGTIAGYAMGRSKAVDRYADPWLVVLINMPALVIDHFRLHLDRPQRNRGDPGRGHQQTAERDRRHARGRPRARSRARRNGEGLSIHLAFEDSSRRDTAARALSGGQFAFRSLDRLEDRAGGRIDRTSRTASGSSWARLSRCSTWPGY